MQVHFEVIKVETHRFFGIEKDGKGKTWEEFFFPSTGILEEKGNYKKEHIYLKDEVRVFKRLLGIAFQEKFWNLCP